MTIAVLVFAAVLAVIASERVDRTKVALVGALLVVLTQTIDQEHAIEAVDWETTGLFVMVGALEEGRDQEVADAIAAVTNGDRTAVLLGVMPRCPKGCPTVLVNRAARRIASGRQRRTPGAPRILQQEVSQVEPKTGVQPATGGSPPARAADPVQSAGAAARAPDDALAGLLARSVRERGLSSAPATALVVGVVRGSEEPVLQRLVSSKAFKKATEVTLAKRGKTMAELDKLLAEYHGLLRINAHARPGAGMNRLQQVLTEIREDTLFWLDSHADDKTDRAKKRRPAIQGLHDEAQNELISMRAARSGALTGDVEAFIPQENKFILKMTGSASSILENLGKAISAAVPRPGDSVSAQVQVRIPCDPDGVAEVGFRLFAEASRSDGLATKVRLEAALSANATVAGLADLTGEFGFFLEAHGKTPQEAMRLISWGWYRQFREARAIPREVANYMWGGSTTSVGFKRSEQWAANVEKEAFKRTYDDDPAKGITADTPLSSGVGSKATTNEYVRFGALAGISAQLGGIASSIVDVEAAAALNAGVHYDQTSVEQAKGRAGVGVPMKERARFNLKHLGSAFTTFETSFSASVGPFSGGVGMALEVMGRAHRDNDQNKNMAYPEGYVSINASLGLSVPAPKFLLQAIATGLKNLVQPLQKASDRIEIKAQRDVKGLALDHAEDQMLTALQSFPTDALAVELGGVDSWAMFGAGAVPLPGSLTLAIAGGYQFGPSTDNFTVDISLSHSVGLDIDAHYLGFSLSRSSRLFRVVIAPGTTRTGRQKKWMIVVD